MGRKKLKLSNRKSSQIDITSSLPPEIMIIIMEYLDLDSLLNCRLVSNRWNQLTNGVKISSVREFRDRHHLTGNFDFTNKSINHSCALASTMKSIKFMKTTFMRSILSSVRNFSMDYVDVGPKTFWSIFESTLAQLTELEHLQINELHFVGEKIIALPNLIILSIGEIHHKSKLIVVAPKLSKLKWLPSFDQLGISDSHITHLSTDELCLADALSDRLYRFERCEYLYLDAPYFPSEFSTIVNNLKVKEIHYGKFPSKNSLIERLNKLSSNVKMYFNSFRITCLDDVTDLYGNKDYLYGVNTQTVIDNYEKLADVVTEIDELDYGKLMDNFGGTLPVDFNSRFMAVRIVSVNQILNSQFKFFKFIKDCKLLNELYIKGTLDIEQSFLDALPHNCPYLEILEIEAFGVISLNSSFIAKLIYLTQYSINHYVPIDLIKSSFRKSLHKISFMLKGKIIRFSFDWQGLLMISNQQSSGPINFKKDFLKEIFQLSSTKSIP